MGSDEETVDAVWTKGRSVDNNEPDVWRKDECGAWIQRDKYGDRNSEYGWEIDHTSPDGGDSVSNLRPLQWKNNLDKSDGRLKCNVKANGVHNVDSSKN